MNLFAITAPPAPDVPSDIGAGSFWMLPQSSTTAAEVDFVFYFILWISALFFAMIVGATIFFLVRYRYRPGRHEAPEASPSHHTPLELTWSIIPSILVLLMFWFGFQSFLRQYTPPANAYEVLVTGQKWSWQFTYPNGYVDSNLHVPVDRDIRLVLSSEDVIHSFFVPAFRLKKDAVPGRYTKVWFRANEPGTYQVFCAEYCGTSHSDMLAKVIVHPRGEFETWLDDAANFIDKMPPAEAGQLLFETRGCTQCHSVDGTPGIGPSLAGVFGREHQLTSGASVVVDENYLRQSILEPQSQVVAGYEPVMPTYSGRLKDQEITVIIEYIKSLSEEGQP
jgi:cytochrome c oxidase subunit 2